MATGVSKTKWNGEESDLLPQGNTIVLSYDGKKSEDDILAIEPASFVELLTGKENKRLYYGDNINILSSLMNETSIKGKVRLVYIDPPFATKSVFQSRSQNDAYQDLLAGHHYVEFMRERLIFLRELLAIDGSIYVHLDDNMIFYVKILMDEIFGVKNFRNLITRKKCNPKNYTRKAYGNISDYILFYSKSDYYVWNRAYDSWSEEKSEKEYNNTEKETGRRFKKVPIHAPGTRNGETGKSWRGMSPPPGKHWQYTPTRLDEMDSKGEIFWSSNGNPRRKVYFDESEGIPVQDIWMNFRDAHNQNIKITGYPTEKNPEMIAQIIKASSNEGDLVLDCFSGSGTALEEANELNRSWIGIDRSTEAISTTLKRFFMGTEAMGDFVKKEQIEKQLSFLPFSQAKLPDFKFLASAPYGGELDLELTKWKKLVEKIGEE